MNKLKRHLNDSLSELEMPPALEADILINAEKPIRKARRRCSRVVIAALAVMCMLGITAAATVLSGGMRWGFTDVLIVTPEQSTHSPLDEGPQAYIANMIATDERDAFFDTFEDFEATLGYSLLHSDNMKLIESESTGERIWFHAGGRDVRKAQLSTYHISELYDDAGKRLGVWYIDTILTLSETPETIPFHYSSLAADPDGPILSQYKIQSLDVAADIVYWPDTQHIGAFFLYNDVSYRVLDYTHHPFTSSKEVVDNFCARLETLHD